jgi:tetratricopeptide (TPR) repeat protein
MWRVSRQPKKSNPAKSHRPWVFLLILLICGAGGLFWFWQRGQGIHQSIPGTGSSLQDGRFQLEEQGKVYSQYAGSASCRECHEEAFAAWKGSHHGLAERAPTASMDETAFEPARAFPHGTQQTAVRKQGDAYELVTAGLSGTNETFAVQRVIAESPLRQMLVAFPGGRLQATEAAWDPRSNQWFNVYGEEDRKPGEWGHWTGRGMNWNNMCAACHNTRVRKNYDPVTDSYRTAFVETGVGCESCHGPMKDHNEWQYANKGKGLKDPTLKKLSRDQVFDNCAACHSRRAEITGDPKPGDSFFDHHLLSIVDDSNLFHPDGQIWDEDYEVTPFLGSRMHHKGVRCVDCHDVHTMKTRLPGNFLCLSCHGPGSTNALVINPVTHSRHKVFGYDTNGALLNVDLAKYKPKEIAEQGGECVNCHMPQTVYMQRHSRHDHGFTIPDPLLTKQFGIPNACNRCHADQNTDWSLQHVETWYGERMNRPYRQRAQVIARARQGDPAARDGLLTMLEKEEIAYWQAVAGGLLERWSDDPGVARVLRGQLGHSNALVRQMAVQGLAPLARAGDSNALSSIQAKLNDPSRNVRIEAARHVAGALDTNALAGSEYLHFLDHASDQPIGRMQVGAFQFLRGDPTNALKHFEKAVKWDPYSAGIRHELAIVYSQMGRTRDAVTQLEAAVRLAPRDAEFHYKLALALNEAGENGRVIPELELAVQCDPRHGRAWYNLGLARNGAGDAEGAVAALLRAESVEPNNARIPYARATILARMGRMMEARAAAQRTLQLEPGSADAATLLRRLEAR